VTLNRELSVDFGVLACCSELCRMAREFSM